MSSAPAKSCSISWCATKSHAKGYCKSHYTRYRKYGENDEKLQARFQVRLGGACSIDGCGRPLHANKVCGPHLKRGQKYGFDSPEMFKPFMVRVPKTDKCSECDNNWFAGGLCHSHYKKKLNKHCSVEGCNRIHTAKGFCAGHYARVKKYGADSANVLLPMVSQRKVAEHGTIAMYTGRACRCQDCRAAYSVAAKTYSTENADAMRLRAKRYAKLRYRRNAATRQSATNLRTPWSYQEDIIVLHSPLSNFELALELGRTMGAIEKRKAVLRKRDS